MTSLPDRQTQTSPITVGIDVAKASVEVAFSDRSPGRGYANEEADHAAADPRCARCCSWQPWSLLASTR